MNEPNTTPLSAKIKRIVYFAIAVVTIIVIFQNREDVETKFLFTTMTMPRVVALMGAMAIGFFLGAMFGKRWLPGGKK